jgi:hypothetical protein
MTLSQDFMKLLPKNLADKSNFDGCEYAWRQEDVIAVMETAKQLSFAPLGGEVQFRYNDGIYELYWLFFGCKDRTEDETWEQYLERSTTECIQAFQILCEKTNFITEGVENFPKLKTKSDLKDHLCFPMYFWGSEDKIDEEIKSRCKK